jgi:hypothetical protein
MNTRFVAGDLITVDDPGYFVVERVSASRVYCKCVIKENGEPCLVSPTVDYCIDFCQKVDTEYVQEQFRLANALSAYVTRGGDK